MSEQFIQFTYKSSGGIKRIQDLMSGMGKRTQDVIKKATLYTEALIKKEFMTVNDGGLLYITKNGQRVYTKRSKQPGVRTSTGHLKRNTRSIFRIQGGAFEGAIGTDIDYGIALEKDQKYEFLKPGLEKARPVIRQMIADSLKGKFVGE